MVSSTTLNFSDMKIIEQALDELRESEFAGPAEISRAKVALSRVRAHIADLEKSEQKITELKVVSRGI